MQTDSKTFKVCDFGSATRCRPGYKPRNIHEIKSVEADLNKHTTIQYRAPEMIDAYQCRVIDQKADIWALGVLLYKLCYYTTPFEQHGPLAILNVQYSIPNYPMYNSNLNTLISSMLRENSDQRPDAVELLKRVHQMRGTLHEFKPPPSVKPTPSPMLLKSPNVNRSTHKSISKSLSTSPLKSKSSPTTTSTTGVNVDSKDMYSLSNIKPQRRGRPTKVDESLSKDKDDNKDDPWYINEKIIKSTTINSKSVPNNLNQLNNYNNVVTINNGKDHDYNDAINRFPSLDNFGSNFLSPELKSVKPSEKVSPNLLNQQPLAQPINQIPKIHKPSIQPTSPNSSINKSPNPIKQTHTQSSASSTKLSLNTNVNDNDNNNKSSYLSPDGLIIDEVLPKHQRVPDIPIEKEINESSSSSSSSEDEIEDVDSKVAIDHRKKSNLQLLLEKDQQHSQSQKASNEVDDQEIKHQLPKIDTSSKQFEPKDNEQKLISPIEDDKVKNGKLIDISEPSSPKLVNKSEYSLFDKILETIIKVHVLDEKLVDVPSYPQTPIEVTSGQFKQIEEVDNKNIIEEPIEEVVTNHNNNDNNEDVKETSSVDKEDEKSILNNKNDKEVSSNNESNEKSTKDTEVIKNEKIIDVNEKNMNTNEKDKEIPVKNIRRSNSISNVVTKYEKLNINVNNEQKKQPPKVNKKPMQLKSKSKEAEEKIGKSTPTVPPKPKLRPVSMMPSPKTPLNIDDNDNERQESFPGVAERIRQWNKNVI